MQALKFDGVRLTTAAAALFALATAAHADVTLITFDVPAADLAAVTAAYGFTTSGPSFGASVQGGQLQMQVSGGSTLAGPALNFGTFAGDVTISIDAAMTTNTGIGSLGLGLQIGDNRFLFCPGYGGGCLRIEGPNGHGNLDMGFTPTLNSPMNLFSIALSAATGTAVITVTDGSNPALTYSETFVDQNYLPGSTIFGLHAQGSGSALFDNLRIEVPSAIPEPGTWALMLLGLGVAGGWARRQAGSR